MMTIAQIKEALQQIDTINDIPKEWLDDSRKGVINAINVWVKNKEKQQVQYEKIAKLKEIEQKLHQQGYLLIAGIDEVGRGPLAGPVLAAAVIMPENSYIVGVNDSKQLSMQKREELYTLIMQEAVSVGIGIVEPKIIDDVNIYEATKMAMQSAIENLGYNADYLLIDAMSLNNDIPQLSLIKGDAKSYSIACASIVAKVTRDCLMIEYAKQYVHYGFEKNAGYGTKEHLDGIKKYGITPIHRRSFEPIKSLVNTKDSVV